MAHFIDPILRGYILGSQKQRRTEQAPKPSPLEPFQHLGGAGSLITESAYADSAPTDFSRARANGLRFDPFPGQDLAG